MYRQKNITNEGWVGQVQMNKKERICFLRVDDIVEIKKMRE